MSNKTRLIISTNLGQVDQVIFDETVHSFDVVAKLFSALGEAAGDLLRGPHVAVQAGVLQQLENAKVDVAIASHHLDMLAVHAWLYDVSV